MSYRNHTTPPTNKARKPTKLDDDVCNIIFEFQQIFATFDEFQDLTEKTVPRILR